MKDLGKVVASIEARMTSSRLPGKVLMPVLGKPILFYLVERLKSIAQVDEIVLATTTNSQDDALEEFSRSNDIQCYRGSEDDVMLRVIEAVQSVNGNTVVEITGDCPILDTEIASQVISLYQYSNVKYASNAHIRSYPDGMDVQVFSLDSLIQSEKMTSNFLHREHVSLHIRENPNLFPQANLLAPPSMHHPQLGLTLDEIGDFKLIKLIIDNLYSVNRLFSCQDILVFLMENPDLVKLNESVKRKGNS
jgi:spore coat polysaccharide biosynthesis protein SpsF